MGKSKPRNRAKHRTNPTAKEVKPPTDPELAALRQKRILPVIKDLQSPEQKTRSAAARAITNLIEDTKTRKLLLREQIVKILLQQTLTDSSLETRTDGWGILQNLVLEEERDFCVHLYRQDILTAIEGASKSIVQTLESQDAPFTKLSKPQQQVVWTFTSSIVSLISSLSEAQDEIVGAITKLPSINNFLFGLLSLDATPTQTTSEVLACLTALLEDNEALAQKVVGSEDWFNKLIQIKDSNSTNVLAACGVLHNLFVSLKWYDHNTPIEGASDATLIPKLVQFMDRTEIETSTNGHSKHSSPDQVLQLALEITASIATSLQEALEHGSHYEKEFQGFDDAELMNEDAEEMEINREDDGEAKARQDEMDAEAHAAEDGEMNEDEMDADMELVTGHGSDVEETASEDSTLERLVRIAAGYALLLAIEKNNNTSHAISTLNNIAWTVSTIDFSTGHLDNLYNFWVSLTQRIWKEVISPILAADTADIELASIVTSLAWAVSRSVKGVINIKPGEQRKFMALYEASKNLSSAENGAAKVLDSGDDAFQGLGVKCIGVLGSLALDPAPIDLNKEIGEFLLTVLASLPDTPPADTVEALNQLFDIYADKEYSFDEPVFWGYNFLKHLEEIQPKAKRMSKEIDKRLFPELRGRADEAVLNLDRFLIYKRKEKKALKGRN